MSETAVHTATVSEWSEVAEPSATENADVRDVIHLNNLPEDLGEFKGNDEYGFGADNTKLDVEVWWAGSGTGVKEEDEKYLPSTKEPSAPTPTICSSSSSVRARASMAASTSS